MTVENDLYKVSKRFLILVVLLVTYLLLGSYIVSKNINDLIFVIYMHASIIITNVTCKKESAQ